MNENTLIIYCCFLLIIVIAVALWALYESRKIDRQTALEEKRFNELTKQ
jgi:hypothetical protein